VNFDERTCTAVLCNHGCNWDCSICSYKLREDLYPYHFLSTTEVLDMLSSVKVEQVLLLGGEPLIIPDLNAILHFAKEDLKAYVKVAHSNLSLLPPEGVDEIGVSLRAVTKRKHQQLTGAQNIKVLSNIYRTYDNGVKLKMSTILIPEVITLDEVEKISEFVASVDQAIPFHITSYIPVPGIPWRSPDRQEMQAAVDTAKKHLTNVTCSMLTVKDYLLATSRDSLHSRHEVA
jgi:pyruvate formate lyase activating enzyme